MLQTVCEDIPIHVRNTYCSATLMKERSYVTYGSLCKIHFFSYVAIVIVVIQLCMLWHISFCEHLVQQSIILSKMFRKYLPKDRTANYALHHILYRYLQSILGFQNTIVSWYRHKFNLCLSEWHGAPCFNFHEAQKFSIARSLTPNSTQLDNK